MKQLFTIFLILVCSAALAQIASPLGAIRHSAADQAGNLHLRWDDFSGGQGTTECYYSAGTNTWSSAATTAYSATEMEAQVPYAYGQKLRYRLRYATDYMGESLCLLHPAFWDAETFPPNLNRMAYIATDATGDSVSVYSPNLDIEETYAAKGPQKLYYSMKNTSGLFPTMNSITSFNVYMALIINPEAATDTLAYAMVYSFNIPGLISNGLYKLSFDSSSSMPAFTRLGNIQAQVSSGALHMACNFADLTADPDFGAWPNASNSLAMEATTVAVTLVNMQPELGFGDYSDAAFLVMDDNYYQQTANILPSAQVLSYSDATHILSLSYSDPQGDFPLVAEVQTPSGTVVQAFAEGQDFSAPVTYNAVIPMEDFDHLSWRFSDNGTDMVNGEYTVVAVQDPQQLVSALHCSIQNPIRNWPVQIKLSGLEKQPLLLCLYNIRGQKVMDIFSDTATRSEMELTWNANSKLKNLASGVYFLAINQKGHSTLQRIVLMK